MKRAHSVINILLLLASCVFLLHLFILKRDVASFTFGLETGPIRFMDHYYQYYVLDQPINRYSIKEDINRFISERKITFQNDGHLVVRIIIDKDGTAETLRFSYLDDMYNQTNIADDTVAIDKLLQFLKVGRKWDKGVVNSKPKKYHLVVNVKIRTGKVSEIF
ncbi:MAG: hypothetical protein ACTIJ8_01360 [Sphingobacterium sp.]